MPFDTFPYTFFCCHHSYTFTNITEFKRCTVCHREFKVVHLRSPELSASGAVYEVEEVNREPLGYPPCPGAPKKAPRHPPRVFGAERRCLSGSFPATTEADALARRLEATGFSSGLKWACECNVIHEAHIPICRCCQMPKPQ